MNSDLSNLLLIVTSHLAKNNQTVATAESCTGGLLSSELTSLSGSSQWFAYGWVVYSNIAKQRLLNVSCDTLSKYGAVSETVVLEMAKNALHLANSNYALSISGIAGPTGGSLDKPVGTVCFGIATPYQQYAQTIVFSGSRDEVRKKSVQYALNLLNQFLYV